MKQERLNDELTIVGLVLLVFFIIYYLFSYINKTNRLEERLIQAQTIAIKLDSRLTKTEERLDASQEKITILQSQMEENEYIDSIVKDIATSWDN